MYPCSPVSVVFEKQLVEIAVGEDEVKIANAFFDVADVDVGSLAEHVLRCSYAVDGLIECRASISAVDEYGAELVAQGLQHGIA